MSPPSSQDPEGVGPRHLPRAEEKTMGTEAFPEFAEPTLASDTEIDQIVDPRTGRRGPVTAAKPTMRVDAAMLRGSGLLSTLPEFLGQLAKANLEMETMLASNPDAARFELDEDDAASQPHVEMNLFAGLVETQRRRHQRRIVLPDGYLLSKLPGAADKDNGEQEPGIGGMESLHRYTSGDEDNGDDTDASTSTAASLRANLKKRKAAAREHNEDTEEAGAPNQIRLQYQSPPPKLHHFDMKRRKLLHRRNPAAVSDYPFKAEPERHGVNNTPAGDDRPSSSGSSTSSGSGPTPITKIRVPSRSPDGSRSSSPDRIILLRHPVLPPSSSAKGVKPSSLPREDSPSEDSSASSRSSSSDRRPRIRVLQKERRDALKKEDKTKTLIEEVQ